MLYKNLHNMIRFIKYFIIIIFIALSSTLFGQRLLTVEEAVATALNNNYDIQLARNDSLSAAIDYAYRNLVFFPSLNANAATTWNNNNQKQELVDSTRKSKVNTHNIQANVALDWVLFDGFKMFATRDKAKALLEAGSYTIKQQMIATIANVIRIYYNIARQKQQINAADVQIVLNQERAKLSQYKLDIGVGAKPDVLQSKVDLNAQLSLKMQEEANVDILKQQLIQAMNVAGNPEFEVPDTIPVNYSIVLGDVLKDLEINNPSLLLAQKNIEIANYTLKETRADLFPTISFNSSYNYSKTNNSVALTLYSPLSSQTNGINYGFTASIPIFNQLNVRRQIRHNQLDISYQKLQYENQKSQLNLSILNAFRNYEQQKKALQLEEENIILARENVDIVFQTYRLGLATLLQLREAQNSLAQAYDRLIEARYNAKLTEIDLMQLRGDIVK